MQNYIKNAYYPKSAEIQKAYPKCSPIAMNTSGAGSKVIILEVTNSTNEDKKVVLFDANASNFLKDGSFSESGVTIKGLSLNYQAFLNRLSSVDQYCIGMIKLLVAAGNELQLQNPITVRDDLPLENDTNLGKTIYPSVYISPMQQQANIVDVMDGFTLTHSVSLEQTIRANTTQTMTFFIIAGRQLG